MSLIDLSHPFYQPTRNRVLVSASVLGWAVFEFVSGSAFWGVLFTALGAYCLYQFFVVYPREHG